MSTAPHLHPDAKQRRVVCAAHRCGGSIIAGPRHFDPIIHAQVAARIYSGESRAMWRGAEQGFIDQWGTFMTREEALQVALAAGQRIYRCGGDETRLYSENLY